MAKTTLELPSELLRWARESAGLSVEKAAKSAGLRSERLSDWESSASATPTARQLERLADVYKRPVAVFFLPAPPVEPPLPLDFRAFADGDKRLSAPTLLAIRKTRAVLRADAELAADLGEAIQVKLPQLNGNPVGAGKLLREHLAVPVSAFRGSDPYQALSTWRQAVEQTGVAVLQFGMPLKEVRGFSLTDVRPAVVLNSKDAPTARVFTLLHEVVHLAKGEPGICNPDEGVERLAVPAIERYCDVAATEALVPTDVLMGLDAVKALRHGGDLASALRSVASFFGVSRHVILVRLRQAGLATTHDYDRMVATWNEEARNRPKRKSGGPTPPVRAVSELGPAFVSRVLRARGQELVSEHNVAELLGVRVKHVDAIRELVRG